MTTEEIVVNKLVDWFEKNKYYVSEREKAEGNEIDVFAYNSFEKIGVEVKAGITKSQTDKAILQVIKFKPYVNYSYVCFPFLPDEDYQDMCKSINIGLIVTEPEINIKINAIENKQLKDFKSSRHIKINNHNLIKEYMLFPYILVINKFQGSKISSGYVASIIGSSQQTASRQLIIACERGYIDRVSKGSHYSYFLTDKGIRYLNKIVDDIKNGQKIL